jgi:hypothetical protein
VVSDYLTLLVGNSMLHLPGFCAVIRVARVWMKKQSGTAIATILLSSPATVATCVTTCKDRNHVSDTSGLAGLRTDRQTEGVKAAARALACFVFQARRRIGLSLSGCRPNCDINQYTGSPLPYCLLDNLSSGFHRFCINKLFLVPPVTCFGREFPRRP